MSRAAARLGGRAIPALLVLWAAGLAAAPPARAEPALVVLDRGRDAKPRAAEDAALAARIARALGADVPLLLQAAKPDGATRSGEAKGASEEDLAEDARSRTRGAFEGESDPRLALATAWRRREQDRAKAPGRPAEEPLLVVLVGPFGSGGGSAAEAALAAWNQKAPEGTRVFAIGASPAARELLAGARGFVAEGLVVLGFGPVEAETAPFSPFARDADGRPPPYEAVLRVPLVAYGEGEGTAPARAEVLRATAGPAGGQLDRIETDSPDAAGTATPAPWGFRLLREREDGRVATVSFQVATDPRVLVLAAPPAPRTVTWDRLAPDARLVGPDDGPVPPFRVAQAALGRTYTARCRLLRTRVGPAPVWNVEGDTEPLAAGLSVHVAPEVFVSDEIAESQVTLHFAPTEESPPRAEGRLRIGSRDLGLAFALPYALEVLPGLVRLEVSGAEATLPLPLSRSDARWRLALEPRNVNAPPTVTVAARVEPESAASRLHLQFVPAEAGGDPVATPSETPALLRTGLAYRVEVALHPGDGGEGLDGARLSFEVVPTAGLRSEGGPAGGTLRSRHPRLLATPPDPRYRVADDAVAPETPLTLAIDPDGGDGPWLAALAGLAPQVAPMEDGYVDWAVEPAGPMVWRLTATGAWKGGRAGAFTGREVRTTVRVTWAGGAAPGEIGILVVQPPRWGALGYVLLGFAGVALALAVFAWRQMRPPPLSGAVLWTAEGLAGVVGRLDLASAGRRTTSLRSDAEGRLVLGGTAGVEVVRLRPTRVGGLVEVPLPGGGSERRLLVEGFSLTVGRHRLRYVAGAGGLSAPLAADDSPDLLGPEYDMESGRISGTKAPVEPVDPDGPAERS